MTTLPRRLHPATMLIELARRLASFAYIIIVALALRFFGSRSSDGGEVYEYILAGVAVLSALGAVFRYLTLGYAIEAGNLIIRSGLITRQTRSIPIDRIQNMTLKRGVLHQLLGVVDVEIETAGGAKAEAVLSALSHAAAQQLKLDVRVDRDVATPLDAAAAPIADDHDLVWRSPIRDLILAGATENRVGLILATIFGGWYTFREPMERLWNRYLPSLESVLHESVFVLASLAALFVVLLVIIGWVTSIIFTVTQYYGFHLRQSDGRLRVRFGLFTQNERLIPSERIQVVRLAAPWLRDRLGYLTVYAETAGSILDHQAAASTPLCPLVNRDRVAQLLSCVLPRV
ncbi:MAG: PH domain-containing protein, partial [Phycisphaerae bacterium]